MEVCGLGLFLLCPFSKRRWARSSLHPSKLYIDLTAAGTHARAYLCSGNGSCYVHLKLSHPSVSPGRRARAIVTTSKRETSAGERARATLVLFKPFKECKRYVHIPRAYGKDGCS